VTADRGVNPFSRKALPLVLQEIPSDAHLALVATQSPTCGPGSACHTPGVLVSECGEGEPVQNMHRPWIGPRRGSGDDTYLDPVWCGPVRLRHCSPPGRRPDVATWPTACDVSRRAEPDVRPPGYAAPAFIADKARRLSGPLKDNVTPQHLMSPIYSAGRDVSPWHLMCHVHSTGRRRACPFRWQAVRPCYGVHCAHHHLCVVREASAARQCYADHRYQVTRRLHWRLALVAPSITSVMSLGPHVGAQHPCTCPHLAIKGEARNVIEST
jgi:hypothetical protein